jgi:hypothetical protein
MRCDVRSGPPGGENRDSRVKEGAQRGESEWEGKGRNARQNGTREDVLGGISPTHIFGRPLKSTLTQLNL